MVSRSSPPSRDAVGLCLAVALLAVVAAGGADAAPPPRPVCAGCGDAFEERASAFGVDVTVTNSTARVTVHGNGTGIWVVRNAVEERDALARLRANETLRAELADARYWDVRVLSTNVSEDGTVTARYRDPDFAREGRGETLVSGAFTHEYGYRNLEGLGADRLVVVAPDGMEIAQTVPGAKRTDDRTRTVLTHYDRGGFVTFVPDGSAFGFLRGWLAIAALVGPVVALNAAVAVLVPAAVVGSLVGLSTPALRRVPPALDDLGVDSGRGLATVGVVCLAFALFVGAVGRFGVLAPLLLGASAVTALAGLAWSRFGLPRLTFRRVGALALVGAGAAAAAAIGGSLLFSGRVYWYGLSPRLPALLALFALVPAGYAVQRGARWRGVIVAVAGVAAALAMSVPLATRFWSFRLPIRLLFAMADAVVLAAVGVPFLVVGAVLAAHAHTDAGTGT